MCKFCVTFGVNFWQIWVFLSRLHIKDLTLVRLHAVRQLINLNQLQFYANIRVKPHQVVEATFLSQTIDMR
jgi:hypothetical protein